MKKIIVIIGVLTTTSCGMFTTLTEEQEYQFHVAEYKIEKAYLDYVTLRDSIVLEYRYKYGK